MKSPIELGMDKGRISFEGFKSEWATVKDGTLIIGSLGKEWTTSTGDVINHNPEFVKTVSPKGEVQHHDWTDNYVRLREAVNIKFPGKVLLRFIGVLLTKSFFLGCFRVLTSSSALHECHVS